MTQREKNLFIIMNKIKFIDLDSSLSCYGTARIKYYNAR